MSRGLAFWILMLVWLAFWLSWHFALFAGAFVGFAVVPFLLFGLLGWQVFGPPLR